MYSRQSLLVCWKQVWQGESITGKQGKQLEDGEASSRCLHYINGAQGEASGGTEGNKSSHSDKENRFGYSIRLVQSCNSFNSTINLTGNNLKMNKDVQNVQRIIPVHDVFDQNGTSYSDFFFWRLKSGKTICNQ